MSHYSDTRDAGAGWLIGAVKNNPEGLLLLAAGCALLMRSFGGLSTRTPITRDYSRTGRPRPGGPRVRTVGERLADTAQSAGDYVSDIGGSVAESASSYASSVSNYADDVARGAAEQTGRLANQAQNTISQIVQDRPLMVALAGVAAGAAVAAAFPVTDLENRTLGATGEQLRDAAGRAGEQLKGAASKAGERLAAAADERGLNTEGLKDVARDVGEAFSGALETDDTKRGQSAGPTSSRATNNQRGASGKKGGSN